MNFVGRRLTSLMLGSLAVAALLSLAAGTGPATASTERPQAAEKCNNVPAFFGLHGMGEGPSKTISAISPELESFDTDQNAISGAVGIYPVPYPTIYPSNLRSLATTNSVLKTGESNLDHDLKSYTKGCSASKDKIALVGYSMGAWVINKWIVDHASERRMIKAVVLYGDPCWTHGKDRGLDRLSQAGDGCMSAEYYPYPKAGGAKANGFAVQSWTMPRDPVTGAGWGANKVGQLAAAVGCTSAKTCSHLDYTGSTEIYQGAQFVVSRLVG